MAALNALSIVVLSVCGAAVLIGLFIMAGALIEDKDDMLQGGAITFFIGLIAAVVFFAGSVFPAW